MLTVCFVHINNIQNKMEKIENVDSPGLGRVLDKSTRVQVQVHEKITSTSTSTKTGFSKGLEYKYRVL